MLNAIVGFHVVFYTLIKHIVGLPQRSHDNAAGQVLVVALCFAHQSSTQCLFHEVNHMTMLQDGCRI